jgi:signal transduction histidine kinase
MPKGGNLAVNACREDDGTVICVADTGVGISEEIRGKMFSVMFTTKSKGQGFGLPVVKRMTEALGGTVTFESEAGKGTKFIVRLPPKEVNGKLGIQVRKVSQLKSVYSTILRLDVVAWKKHEKRCLD